MHDTSERLQSWGGGNFERNLVTHPPPPETEVSADCVMLGRTLFKPRKRQLCRLSGPELGR